MMMAQGSSRDDLASMGPEQPAEKEDSVASLENTPERSSHDLESYLPATFLLIMKHRQKLLGWLHDTTYTVILVMASALYVSTPSLTGGSGKNISV